MKEPQEILQGIFLFQGTKPPPEAELLPVETFSRGTEICQPGGLCRGLAVLVSGRAEALPSSQEGAVLTSFGPGSVFGAASLFGGGTYVSSVRAVTPCRVMFLPEELLRTWFAKYPDMAVRYMTFLSARVRFLNSKIALFTQDTARQRLYRYLAANCDREGRLPRGVTMTKLAEMLSIGRTSLYRALASLEEENLAVRKDGVWRVIR